MATPKKKVPNDGPTTESAHTETGREGGVSLDGAAPADLSDLRDGVLGDDLPLADGAGGVDAAASPDPDSGGDPTGSGDRDVPVVLPDDEVLTADFNVDGDADWVLASTDGTVIARGTVPLDEDGVAIVTGGPKKDKWVAGDEAEGTPWKSPEPVNALQRTFPVLNDGDSRGEVAWLARFLGRSEATTYDLPLQLLADKKLVGEGEPTVPFMWGDWAEALPELSLGDTGPTVGALQRFLLEMGYKPSEYNRFDVPTEFAVKAYQSHHGLVVHGRVDRDFWRLAMFQEVPELS